MKNSEIRAVQVVSVDERHDLAILKFGGKALSPLRLADDNAVREGEVYAFTGYPLGAVLGLYAATKKEKIVDMWRQMMDSWAYCLWFTSFHSLFIQDF